MPTTPALPLLTKWPCADTCITAYNGFCERFTYTGVWPATAQCLLGTCDDKDRIALQKSVAEYCDAVGYPDVWGPYMWGATDDDKPSSKVPIKDSTSSIIEVVSTTIVTLTSPAVSVPQTTTLSTTLSTATPAPNDALISSSTSPKISSTLSPEPEPSSSSGLPTGAKVGIAVGVVLAVALVFLVLFLLRWRKRRNEPNFREGPDHLVTPSQSPKAKVFEEEPIISYTIEDGTLKRKDKKPPALSIKVL